MKPLLFLLFIILLCTGFSSQGTNTEKTNADKDTIFYGKFVSILLGIHNEHLLKDSLKIEMVNSFDSVAFLHQGPLNGWGMRDIRKKIRTGKYNLILSWYEDNKRHKTSREILIKPETDFFSLNIELANDPQRRKMHNAIYLNQYTNSIKSVEFKRIWNPQEQFKKDTLLLPNYEVTNKNDSTLYGAYLRFSSMLSINWVQSHYIAFMGFEQKSDSNWTPLSCNAPRLEMNLKKGSTGKTLTDMVLGCPISNFLVGETYRVRIDYMFNNTIYEKNPPKGQLDDNVYVEQTIYMYTDEFKLK